MLNCGILSIFIMQVMQDRNLILDFGLRILDLRYSVYFIRQNEAIPPIRNPKFTAPNE
ncbi:hypothetical protein D1AOALGA4SA_1934 [Olavius algarvensis Delta 1 endosymbiont]|nr:hypothetical protein D1AOALGA4SA_1934 [Olavius algarvensis Delta 1 endosymbiont]